MFLAIDTSAGTGVAVADEGEIAFTAEDSGQRTHAERLGALLRQAVHAAPGLTAVVVGMGPGPFTGLRIGIAAARAFAVARGLPVIPVVSHDAIALAAYTAGVTGPVQIVTDARRREIAVSDYAGLDADGLPIRVVGPRLTPADDPPPAEGQRIVADAVPPVALARLAARARSAARLPVADDAALYLRTPDVTLRPIPVLVSLATSPDGTLPDPGLNPGLAPSVSGPESLPSTQLAPSAPAAPSPPPATLRPATYADLATLHVLERAMFPLDAWNADTFAAELAHPDTVYRVATDSADGRILGYVGLLAAVGGDQADIQTLAVVPDVRGRGLGRRLLTDILHVARERGATAVFLEVRADNASARALYADLGFETVGVRRRYYADREDAVRMRLTLTPADPASGPLVLGIETSCDETGVGIVRGRTLLANVIHSSMAEHARFGGVVPEVAARAHLEAFPAVLRQALDTAGVTLADLDAIAVTGGPGLDGALMVGVGAAKGLATGLARPLYAVNHLVGHIGADVLADEPLAAPAVALLVSGGHTALFLVRDCVRDVETLGETLDDAAGEAFDKVARLLGLPYPGGPNIDRVAASGDPAAIPFPRGLSRSSDLAAHRFDFSFSGLKTAVLRWVEQHGDRPLPLADVAASFREAVVDVLVNKALAACATHGVPRLLLGGGVAANARLRALVTERAAAAGVTVRIPPPDLCTDNGGMIAAFGARLVAAGLPPSALDVGVDSTLPASTVYLPAPAAHADPHSLTA